jgi:preprotein translocase subunit SecF
MSEHPHKFRYLLPPGSNFQFMSKARAFMFLAAFTMVGAIVALFVNKSVRGEYMNWTIDFRGGTEVTFEFAPKGDPAKRVRVDAGAVRAALKDAGEDGFDVSETSWNEDGRGTVNGMMVKTPRFSAMKQEQADAAQKAFAEAFPDKQVEKASWSGERFYVRSKASFVTPDDGNPETKEADADFAKAKAPFAVAQLELKPWSEEDRVLYMHADEGTGEYNSVFAIRGIDQQLEQALEKGIPDVDAIVQNSYGVGAKAGAELRNDAIKAVIYALFLIVLYLAFRFDLRYAPGAAFATIHDALAVVLVFAVTWTEVSLTTVAAILTVVGYSVNDTVIIFDRIRENQAKLKDKKMERIVDISLNETLVRSILTSSTVFATTLIMNIFGDGLVRNFAFAMNVGVIVGTYSSLFLAPPIFLWISRRFYSGTAKQRAYKVHAVQAEE